jgi:hypothetical protein
MSSFLYIKWGVLIETFCLTLLSTIITIYTTRLIFEQNFNFSHTVYLCFMCFSEWTRIIFLNNINRFSFVLKAERASCAIATELLDVCACVRVGVCACVCVCNCESVVNFASPSVVELQNTFQKKFCSEVSLKCIDTFPPVLICPTRIRL